MATVAEQLLTRERLNTAFFREGERTARDTAAAARKRCGELELQVEKLTQQLQEVEGVAIQSFRSMDKLRVQVEVLAGTAANEVKAQESRCAKVRGQVEDLRAELAASKAEASTLREVLQAVKKGEGGGGSGRKEEEELRAENSALKELCRQKSEMLDSVRLSEGVHAANAQRYHLLFTIYGQLLNSLHATQDVDRVRDGGVGVHIHDAAMEEVVQVLDSNASLRAEVAELHHCMEPLRRQAAEHEKTEKKLREAMEALDKKSQELERHQHMAKLEAAVREATAEQEVLRRGSITALLTSFYMSPTRCPACHTDLSTNVGLRLLAKAAGYAEGGERDMVYQMVRTLCTDLSAHFQRQGVAAILSLEVALKAVERVPEVVLHLPKEYFFQVVRNVEFGSETQPYALVLSYLDSAPKLIRDPASVEQMLDEIRFLWLPTTFIESEIARLEAQQQQQFPYMMQDDHPYDICVEVRRGLFQRLVQTLRFKSMFLQQHSPFGGAAHPLNSLHLNVSPLVLQEAQRLRPSYLFIPQSLRATLMANCGEGKEEEGGERYSFTIQTLAELQNLCC